MANVNVARAVLAQITEHPESHNQQWYALRASHTEACATQLCVAGWSVHFAHPGAQARFDPWALYADNVELPGGVSESYHEAGRFALGLDRNDADWLFDEDRTRAEVLTALENLTAGRELLEGIWPYDPAAPAPEGWAPTAIGAQRLS